MNPTRRTILAGAGALSVATLLRSHASAEEPPPLDPGPEPELLHPMIERTSRPLNYESPRDVFTKRITPIDRFYVRNHFDLPSVDAATWALTIEGLVDRPQHLTLAQLEALPQVTIEAVLQCAGSGRGLFAPHVAGVQWTRGAAGNATWTGPRLKDVLALAAPQATAAHLELQGLDRAPLEQTPKFIRGIPLTKGLHEDTIVALKMNDVPLPRAHGYPARLVVPGWVGDDWMKWLTRIAVLAEEPKGFFYETAYRFPITPGAPGVAVPPDQTRPMQQLVVQSVIGAPWTSIVPGHTSVRGVAYGGEAAVAKVDVSVDGGATWQEAKLERGARYGFALFELPFAARPGKLVIQSRATDEAGNVQPMTPVWNPSGYLYNAVDRVDVEVWS